MFDWIIELIYNNKQFFSDPYLNTIEDYIEQCGARNILITNSRANKIIGITESKTGKSLISFTIRKKAKNYVNILYTDNEAFDPNKKYGILDSVSFNTHAKYYIHNDMISVHNDGIEMIHYEKDNTPYFTVVGEEKFFMIPTNIEEDEYFHYSMIYDIPTYQYIQDLKKLGKYSDLETNIDNISINQNLTIDDVEYIKLKMNEICQK